MLKIFSKYEKLSDQEKSPAELKERFNKVGYEAHERLTLALESTLKDLDKKIENIEKFIQDEIDSVLNSPPGAINMLHDEMSIGKAVENIVYIKGDTRAKELTLDPSVSGDVGLKSAVVTPGSWKDIWNLRSESIFGSVQGFSRIASYLGMKNLEAAINAYEGPGGGGIVRFITDLEKMNNAVDASAQAVTMATAIARDFGPEGDRLSQSQFSEVLSNLNYLFKNAGGLDKIRRELDIAASEIEAKYLSDPDAIDKYSQVALRYLREQPPSSAWGALFARTRTEDDAKALNMVSSGDGDIAGEIGVLLRKKIFKPPVMTIVYGAGAPAFRKQILEGLEDIAEVIARSDPKEAEKFRSQMSEMANDLVDEIVQNDLIRDELGIPTANDLVEMFRKRPLSDNLSVPMVDAEGRPTGAKKTFTVEDIVNGDWITDPQYSAAVYRHLIEMSKEKFDVASPELGLWYAKLLLNNDKKRINRAVANVRKKVKESLNDDGTLNLDKLNEKFTPINTYLSSLDSANRLGFLADNDIMRRQMDRLGVTEEDLDPIAARALLHQTALYQNTGPAAGRKFGFFDGPIIVRNQNPETTVHEVLNVNNQEQLGQVVLDDGFKKYDGSWRSRCRS